ncbi:MAG: class I SAM-dependent methyltransferase, partial [Gemmatimonadota bacterium]
NFDRRRDEHLARYGRRFFRMWKYYLLASAGTFRSRRNQLWQVVLSPRGVPGGYSPLRDWVPAVGVTAKTTA